ncbi:MAG: SiaB family protein kinase [Bacteroidetes bacterium]|nr:SiaB family protein kinase [Bacteroidota bacterium]
MNDNAEFFKQNFSKQVENVNAKGELILAFDGVLTPEIISKLEGEIENKILDKALPKPVVRKVFFISIESLQNMFIHGYKDTQGEKHNFFILYLAGDSVKIITANLIANSAIERVKGFIDKINSFDNPADLRNYYLHHLETNELSEKGGAGLGFITIGMKSGNKLGLTFEKISEAYALFQLEVTINVE